jgi:hypothetical protein
MSPTWLIRGTAWLSFALYVASEALLSCRTDSRAKVARWMNSLGCAAMFVHIAFAFHLRHDWSHDAARADTARQTAAVTGLNWGGGVYINYLFGLVWLWAVARWWRNDTPNIARRDWGAWTLRAFFLFMYFNAAVVFVPNLARWFGLLGCAALIVVWFPRSRASPA